MMHYLFCGHAAHARTSRPLSENVKHVITNAGILNAQQPFGHWNR